jgi:hypothetical protein
VNGAEQKRTADLFEQLEAERKERKLAHALVERLQADLSWKKREHDNAREEWIIMRERLNALHKRLTSARETVTPPPEWKPAWADYGDGLEADPYGWLDTLVAEALADNPPVLTYDEEATSGQRRLTPPPRAATGKRCEVSVSTQNPRYFNKRGRHNWRFKLRYPCTYLRMKLLWRWRRFKRRFV